MSTSRVAAFECNVKGTDWQQVVHARTAGKAKSEYLRHVRDAWPEVPYTAVTVRCLGVPRTDSEFARVAAYRGMPHVRIGDRVQVGDCCGAIVGHNRSANFDVLFDDDAPKYAGQVLNVHPASVVMLPAYPSPESTR